MKSYVHYDRVLLEMRKNFLNPTTTKNINIIRNIHDLGKKYGEKKFFFFVAWKIFFLILEQQIEFSFYKNKIIMERENLEKHIF